MRSKHGERRRITSSKLIIRTSSCFYWKQLASRIKKLFPDSSSTSISYQIRTMRDTTYLALMENRIAGFVLYYIRDSHVVWLEMIGVLRERRRCGIGEMLLARVFQDVVNRGLSKVQLAVDRDNIPASKLYEKCGFVRLPRKGEKITYERRNVIAVPKTPRSETTIALPTLVRRVYWKIVYWVLVGDGTGTSVQ